MGRRQLLFVTYHDENIEEGVSYAVELAKAMYEDITLLLVQKKRNLIEKLENLMTAVSFAEADERDMARQMMAGGPQDKHKNHERKITEVVNKCHREGIQVNVHTTDLDAISGIRTFLKEHTGIDKVVLSPAVTGNGNVSAKDLNRLVRTASRPIVTMTRQACTVA